MVTPQTVLRSVKEAIKSSDRLPKSTSYAVFELDFDGGQADVGTPVVELTSVDTLRSNSVNTDFVGYSQDGSGNDHGIIYRAGFQMPITINVITAEGDGHDPKEIGNEIRLALYQYEDRQEGAALPDPDSSGSLSNITHFELSPAEPNNDLTMTYAMRGWQQSAQVWFEEVIDTAKEYGAKEHVSVVKTPQAGDGVGGTDIDVVFDVTASESSPADDHT